LGIEDLLRVIHRLKIYGLKTIEITGGGDPTLYQYINELIEECYRAMLKIGFITNGVALLDNVLESSLRMLSWLRVSMNCLDYVPSVDLPKIEGTLGFSYVVNDRTKMDTLLKVKQYAEKHKAKYVRIVPNCQTSFEEQDKNNRELPQLAKNMGEPFFYQAKEFKRPRECWWGYFKPFILHDSYVYPCSSVVLNDNADRRFHDRYRWCKMEDLPSLYSQSIKPLSSENCEHCVFFTQNELLTDLNSPNNHKDFI
jgi:MoaA/NifB/PqqE/SkfB family radical SAM enzyme